MVVRIRLARMGRRHEPIYNITVADNNRGVFRKPIEVIGTYNATPQTIPGTSIKTKNIALDFDRAKYWLGVGAQASDTVASIFRKFDLLPKNVFELSVDATRKLQALEEKLRKSKNQHAQFQSNLDKSSLELAELNRRFQKGIPNEFRAEHENLSKIVERNSAKVEELAKSITKFELEVQKLRDQASYTEKAAQKVDKSFEVQKFL
ncbi:ribosomal protein S16 domain-containing protein [Lipomyces oligophaga]|uniref:ribosomal protein S16 domain-containing protein n=1 Tax=Lipomyces oligophaga TaxID=45792 RepID=UPI0034CD21C3